MTYSHNSVGNNNLKMTTTTAAATTKSIARSGSGSSNGSGSGSIVGNKHFNRRTPPNSLITTTTTTTSTPLSVTAAILAFDNKNNDAVHSNSIACSTNMQQHPLMGGSPPNNEFLLTPTAGSYFSNQRKQQQQQQQRNVAAQWKTPTAMPIVTPTSVASTANACSGSGGGAFFSKNNYGGQYFANNSRRKQQKQQQQQSEQRTPNAVQMPRTSPAALLGGGLSNNATNADSVKIMPNTTGRKRRPKMHLQSPIISLPRNLGVGGNISPTHPLLPAVLTHFAGSKFFDAPAPSAVPKPPEHWMPINKEDQQNAGPGLKNIVNAHNNALSLKTRSAAAVMNGCGTGKDLHTLAGHVVKSSKRNLLDEFDTHNLKLLLNVQS